jgi:non-heme chloroperoxidase
MSNYEVSGGNGIKLNVEEYGNPQGQPILFIHGWTQGVACWTKQINSDLADTYRLVCLDSRGHGKSEKPLEMEAYADSKLWADDVAAVIGALNLQKPLVVAWSYGGAVISDYLRYYSQDTLGGIMFVDSTVHVGTPEGMSYLKPEALAMAAGMFSPDISQNIASTIQFMGECCYKELSTADFYLVLGYHVVVPTIVRQALLTRNLDSTEVIGAITIPAVVTHGEEGGAVLPKAGKALHAGIKHSELVFFPETLHMPFLETPARFNQALRDFAEKLA